MFGIHTQIPTGISPDGTQVVFYEVNPATGADLMLLALEPASSSPPAGSQPGQATRHDVRPLLQTRFDERNGTISPDGRWLAYESNSSGRFEIYVRPFPNVDDGRWRRQGAPSQGGRPEATSCST